MLLGDNQDVNWSHRVYIVKRKDMIVLEHDLRRDFARRYLTKNAIVHDDLLFLAASILRFSLALCFAWRIRLERILLMEFLPINHLLKSKTTGAMLL